MLHGFEKKTIWDACVSSALVSASLLLAGCGPKVQVHSERIDYTRYPPKAEHNPVWLYWGQVPTAPYTVIGTVSVVVTSPPSGEEPPRGYVATVSDPYFAGRAEVEEAVMKRARGWGGDAVIELAVIHDDVEINVRYRDELVIPSDLDKGPRIRTWREESSRGRVCCSGKIVRFEKPYSVKPTGRRPDKPGVE